MSRHVGHQGGHQGITEESAELAREASSHGKARSGGAIDFVTKLVSAIALIFSGISLYQTVIKRPNLHLYVPETLSYTRDPAGNHEVFILPVTIANSGARDGIVSSLRLKVRNKDTGVENTYSASYIARADYFAAKPTNDSTQLHRPKEPFAPLAIAGRSGFGGTLLFYPRKTTKERVLTGKGNYELTLSLKSHVTESFGSFDKLWSSKAKPLQFSVSSPKVPSYFEGWIMVGNTLRLQVNDAAGK